MYVSPYNIKRTMQSPPPCSINLNSCNSFLGLQIHHLILLRSLPSPTPCPNYRRLCYFSASRSPSFDGVKAKGKGKENVWSVDNEAAPRRGGRRKGGGREGKTVRGRRRRSLVKRRREDGKVMVSGAMLLEVETILQTQEPVIRPAWTTFASSVSGVWKGVGAVFSPITAEMEPIDLGKKNEYLFDCFTLSHIEVVPSANGGQHSNIQRRVNWVTMNPSGEKKLLNEKYVNEHASVLDRNMANHTLPKFESFDFDKSDVMEEDIMNMEPGLVFFEDGSYSRGPVDIPVGEVDDSNYYLSPTLKFEQCLVKGCHKRLRIVHTIEFNDGGSDIQIMRVAVYEEQWVSTASLPDQSDVDFDSKPLSERKRVQPSELTGSWKVFETSATPIYSEDIIAEESNETSYVYLCTETLKKRSLPDSCFGEEDASDMSDVSVMWLPGGVTGYVDVKKDGTLCIGVGWYSSEGINLVMERDYGVDGKLKDVRYASEVKRRWSDPLPV